MKLVLIEIDSIEWNYMWNWLSNHPINKDLEEPSIALNEGESWQYMGSLKQGDRLIHQFRHRNHPVTQNIQSVSLEASSGMTPEQIHKDYRL